MEPDSNQSLARPVAASGTTARADWRPLDGSSPRERPSGRPTWCSISSTANSRRSSLWVPAVRRAISTASSSLAASTRRLQLTRLVPSTRKYANAAFPPPAAAPRFPSVVPRGEKPERGPTEGGQGPSGPPVLGRPRPSGRRTLCPTSASPVPTPTGLRRSRTPGTSAARRPTRGRPGLWAAGPRWRPAGPQAQRF